MAHSHTGQATRVCLGNLLVGVVGVGGVATTIVSDDDENVCDLTGEGADCGVGSDPVVDVAEVLPDRRSAGPTIWRNGNKRLIKG